MIFPSHEFTVGGGKGTTLGEKKRKNPPRTQPTDRRRTGGQMFIRMASLTLRREKKAPKEKKRTVNALHGMQRQGKKKREPLYSASAGRKKGGHTERTFFFVSRGRGKEKSAAVVSRRREK